MYKIISYFTSTYKETWESYLKPSLEKFNLNYYVEESKEEKDWKTNTDYKSLFIKKCLNKFKENLIFTDVDSIINAPPVLFGQIPPEYDIGIHYFSWEPHYGRKNPAGLVVLSGTIYIKYGPKTLALLDKWIELTPKYAWEQKALQEAIRRLPELKIYKLPREYCYISNQPSGEPPVIPVENPIVEHFQASRKLKHLLRSK